MSPKTLFVKKLLELIINKSSNGQNYGFRIEKVLKKIWNKLYFKYSLYFYILKFLILHDK